MTKILMVCLGNICRSPLAEGILQQQADEAGLDLEVDSAGTSGWHNGEHPDPRSTENAWEHDIDISKQRSRQFTVADFDAFDRIYAMDHSNYNNILSMARNEADQEKVDLILNADQPGSNRAVPDPYYGGSSGFENVYQMLHHACAAVVDDLSAES